MKIKLFALSIFSLCLFLSCTPEMKEINLPDPIDPSTITINSVETQTNNIFSFSSNVQDAILNWDLGNGTKIEGSTVQGSYPFKGNYLIKLTVINKGGISTKNYTLSVSRDNYDLVSDPTWVLLSGGIDNTDGKTWVMDSLTDKHMGLGPNGGTFPEWWAAPILDKSGKKIYDDEFTFTLKGASLKINNHGKSYINGGSTAPWLAWGGTIEPEVNYGSAGGDYVGTLDLTTKAMNWSIRKEGSRQFIDLTGGGFIGFYLGEPQRSYEILNINEDELSLKLVTPGLDWYFKFIRKGVHRDPPAPPKPKDYLPADISFTFEGKTDSPYTWIQENGIVIETVDNPSKIGLNKSSKVAAYKRGTSEWAQLMFDLPVRADLSSKNKIKIKVLLPSEEFTKAQKDSNGNGFDMKVNLRLYDSKNNEPWNDPGQISIVKTITVDQLDKWIELEFDMSNTANADQKRDRVVLQIGGEPHNGLDGTFYFDDLILSN